VTSPRILLLVPPFASTQFPSLAVHQLEAQLRAGGLDCEICYSNALFAELIGYRLYNEISWASTAVQIGERVFAHYLELSRHPGIRRGQRAGIRNVLRNAPHGLKISPEIIWATSPEAELAYRSAIEVVLLERDYDLVGITCGCLQLCATEYHAQVVRGIARNATIVVGGSSCDGEMAEGLASFTRNVDYIFSGEADYAFSAFCRDMPPQRPTAPVIVPCEPIEDLSLLHPPDFSAYYLELKRHRFPDDLGMFAAYQSSRGCWWGERSQCTFCGLNGQTVRYRTKPVEKVLPEIASIMKRHPTPNLLMVDCIMPRRYLSELLPRIQAEVGQVSIFYETKADLKLADLQCMRSSGMFTFQPGIESLSTSLLKRMRKGSSGSGNIRLLVNSRRAGLTPSWNILFGIPGDKRADYEEMLRAAPYLVHLSPPAAVTTISIERFSPLYKHPQEHTIRCLEPLPSYREIFADCVDVGKIGYHHIGDFDSESLTDDALRKWLLDTFERWKDIWRDHGVTLEMVLAGESGTLVVDTRGTINASSLYYLPSEIADLCFLLEEGAVRRDQVDAEALSQLLAKGLMLEYEGRLINLVVSYSGRPAWEFAGPPSVSDIPLLIRKWGNR